MRAAAPEDGKAPINCGETMACGFRLAFLRYISRMSKTVAIVEDDPAIRANYADMLKKHGYQVSAFADRSSPRGAKIWVARY